MDETDPDYVPLCFDIGGDSSHGPTSREPGAEGTREPDKGGTSRHRRACLVIYLGMRVNRITGIKTLLGFGPKISSSVSAQPDGLLRHETVVYSLFPMHVGMRQYWRDLNSLLKWTRSDPHRQWWQGFLKDSGGTGFWHETYFRRGGMEAIYDDVPEPIGFMTFARSWQLVARCSALRPGAGRTLQSDRSCQRRISTGNEAGS
jgi:fumigallin biosynthesis monooxygenase-like protein